MSDLSSCVFFRYRLLKTKYTVNILQLHVSEITLLTSEWKKYFQNFQTNTFSKKLSHQPPYNETVSVLISYVNKKK